MISGTMIEALEKELSVEEKHSPEWEKLAEEEQEIVQKRKKLAEEEQEIAQRKKKLAEEEQEIAQRKKQLAEKEEEIAQKRKKLSTKKIDEVWEERSNPFKFMKDNKDSVAEIIASYILNRDKAPQFEENLPLYLKNEKMNPNQLLEILNVSIYSPNLLQRDSATGENLFHIAAIEGDHTFIKTILDYLQESKTFDHQLFWKMLKDQRLLVENTGYNYNHQGNVFHISAAKGKNDIIATILNFFKNRKFTEDIVSHYVFEDRFVPGKRRKNVFDFGQSESIKTICKFFEENQYKSQKISKQCKKDEKN